MVDNNIVSEINIREACRLCLADENEIDLNAIYQGGGVPYKRIASLLVEVELLENEMFSNRICQECASKLILFYKFKQKCESTNRALHDLIGRTDSPVDPKLELTGDLSNEVLAYSAAEEEHNVDEDDYAASFCDVEINISQKFEENPEKGISKYQCEECGKIFSHYFGLIQHCQQHTRKKQFECKICKLKFTRLYNVTTHMRLHNNERPYECEVCSRKFVKSGDLARHQRIHRDEKNYKCSVCMKAFKRSTDVTSHMRSHTGEKRYKCSQCDKAYSSHSGLKKHLKFHNM